MKPLDTEKIDPLLRIIDVIGNDRDIADWFTPMLRVPNAAS